MVNLAAPIRARIPDESGESPRCAPGIHVRACLLRLRAEDRIPAANVGDHRMRTALGISQGHSMFFAWPAAIAISSAGGKESAEDAMLRVEDRQMLIGYGFQPLRANGCG